VLKRKIKNGRQNPKRPQEVSAAENRRLTQALSKLPIIVGLDPQEEIPQYNNPIEKPIGKEHDEWDFAPYVYIRAVQK